MNERIRELAEQAGFIVDQSGHIMVCFTSDGNDEVKKFAELIMRECIDIVEDAVLRREPASTYVGKIKTHFGIEE